VTEVARSLGIATPESVRRWVIQARIDRGLDSGPTTEEIAVIMVLRKEVVDQQRTIEILTAATSFLCKRPTRRASDGRLHRRTSGLVPKLL